MRRGSLQCFREHHCQGRGYLLNVQALVNTFSFEFHADSCARGSQSSHIPPPISIQLIPHHFCSDRDPYGRPPNNPLSTWRPSAMQQTSTPSSLPAMHLQENLAANHRDMQTTQATREGLMPHPTIPHPLPLAERDGAALHCTGEGHMGSSSSQGSSPWAPPSSILESRSTPV